MQIKVISPEDRSGIVECLEDGSFQIIEGDILLADMSKDLRFVIPNSAIGYVNTIHARAEFVLRTLEYVDWQVGWPEVAGGPDEPDNDDPEEETIVN